MAFTTFDLVRETQAAQKPRKLTSNLDQLMQAGHSRSTPVISNVRSADFGVGRHSVDERSVRYTRVFWNTNPDLMIVGRTEDYITASHPTFIATPREVKRWGTADKNKRSRSFTASC